MVYYGQELCHHGIKGQRWGIRRYQNEDGTLTPAGMKRYSGKIQKEYKEKKKSYVSSEQERKLDERDNAKHNEYLKKAQKLAEKYDFDADDGGGGSTKASRKAGIEYSKLLEKAQDIENNQYWRHKEAAHNYAKNYVESKYGENAYEFSKQYKGRKDLLITVGAMETVLVSSLAALIAPSFKKNKILKRKKRKY